MTSRNKIFFASDLHLGAPGKEKSLVREKHFVSWLEKIKPEAKELYLMGDVFDFWFEYKRSVPKGYVRILGKLAELHDAGVIIHYFTGNHDMWQQDYFKEQFGATIYRGPVTHEFFGKKFYLAHGDGLGPGDKGYKVLKKVFRSPLSQWAFHRLHPNFGIRLAHYFSRKSREKTGEKNYVDHGEKEFLLLHSRKLLEEIPEIDYFVFGHRHYPKFLEFEKGKYYVNLGDWIRFFSYLEVGPERIELCRFPLDPADNS